MFFDAWIATLITLLAVSSIIAMIAYRLETGRPLHDNPWFYAIMCTVIAVLAWILLSEIDEVDPFLTISLFAVGLIAFCSSAAIYAVLAAMSFSKIRYRRRKKKQMEQERRETVESEDFARFIDEDLGMVITVDESRGVIRVLVKEESDDETQED